MSDFNFGIKIGARNDTKAGISEALSGFRSFTNTIAKPITIPLRIGKLGLSAARSSLSVIRDLRLSFSGLASKVDEFIDAGLRFGPQMRSFQSLTGTSEKKAIGLAKSLVAASHGTLTLSRAMQIANRGLASGLGIGQIGTVLDFVSKKSVTTGKDAGQAIDTVITGLSRGSTLFLDDFGILVDGIEGVKRTFDQIKGAGAFDALGPAAQKAEIIKQAMAEMVQQTKRLGITGRESFFIWEGIKNSIASSNERMLAAAASSGALREGLEQVQALVKGITSHFESGGGLTELLFGRKGGKSGGLLGLGGAVMIDLGKLIGKGFVGVVLKTFATMVKMVPKVLRFAQEIYPIIKDAIVSTFREIKSEVSGAIPKSLAGKWMHGAVQIGGISSFGDFKKTLSDLWIGFKDVFDMVFDTNLMGLPNRRVGLAPALTPQTFAAAIAASAAFANVAPANPFTGVERSRVPTYDLFSRENMRRPVPPLMFDETRMRGGGVLAKLIGGFEDYMRHNPVTSGNDLRFWVRAVDEIFAQPLARRMYGKDRMISDLAPESYQSVFHQALNNQTMIAEILRRQGKGGGPVADAMSAQKKEQKSFIDRIITKFDRWAESGFIADINKAADNLLDSSVAFSQTRKAFANFKADFPGKDANAPMAPKPKPTKGDADIPLTKTEERKRRRRIHAIDREIRQIEHGQRGSTKAARDRAAKRIDAMRESGKHVSRADIQRILHEENLSARQLAQRRAAERIHKLRAEGRDVRPSDMRRIRQEELQKVIKERTAPLRAERQRLAESLKKSQRDWYERTFPPADMKPRGREPDWYKRRPGESEEEMNDRLWGTSSFNPPLASEHAKQTAAEAKRTNDKLDNLIAIASGIVGGLDAMAHELGAQAQRLRRIHV